MIRRLYVEVVGIVSPVWRWQDEVAAQALGIAELERLARR